MAQPSAPHHSGFRWGWPAALIALAASLLAVTWGTWPDPIVDFGRELYAPWRLSEGAVLYRDVAWINGPLSPYVNCLAFQLFGVSLRTLVVCNVVVLAVVSVLLYRLTTAMTTLPAAGSAVAAVLSVFGFSQLLGIGNFNFICPYSHELTHGLLLAVAAFYAMFGWMRRGRLAYAFVASLLAGMALLTKPETAIAAVAVVMAYLGCALLSKRFSRSQMLWTATVVSAGLAVPLLLAVLLLSTALGLSGAIRGLLTPWSGALNPQIQSLLYYRVSAGVNQPFAHALRMLKWTGIYTAAAFLVVVLGHLLRNKRPTAWRDPIRLVPALAIAVLWTSHLSSWYEAASGLPAVAAIGLVAGIVLCRSEGQQERGALLCGFSILSLALLAKIALAARVHHYGFVLALPAAVLLVIVFVGYLPEIAARHRASARVVQRASGVLLLGTVAVSLAITALFAHAKTVTVAEGADRFRAELRGRALEDCRRALSGRLRPGATVAVLPEGVMLNYLLRRRSSVPYIVFMPVELSLFGEESVLSSLRASPPDVIALVHKDTGDYGYPLFGSDYGVAIMRWVRQNYRRSLLIGREPLRKPAEFGIEVLSYVRPQ